MKTPITNVAPFMPHAGRMMLITRIVEYDQHSITTECFVDGQHIFATDGQLPNWAFLELMAQSIGALAGALAVDAGEPIRTGFFLGSRKITLSRADLPLPVLLRCEVKESTKDAGGFGVYDCQLFERDKLIAVGALNVFCPTENTLQEGR